MPSSGSDLNAQYPELEQMRCWLHVPDNGSIHSFICSHTALPAMVIRQQCSLGGGLMSGEYPGDPLFPVLNVRVCYKSPPAHPGQDMVMMPWQMYVALPYEWRLALPCVTWLHCRLATQPSAQRYLCVPGAEAGLHPVRTRARGF